MKSDTIPTSKPKTDYCGWRVRRENQINGKPENEDLLQFPYPFKSAVAISNDADFLELESFRELHNFVSGSSNTKYGEGLGLEMGFSFWFWSVDNQFSLFHGHPDQNFRKSPEHDAIVELTKRGFGDTLHGFGEWDSNYKITSEQIDYALEFLRKNELKLSCYVNHGHGNSYNVGGPWGYYQEADLEGSKSYCLDRLIDYGFKFFWLDVCYETEKYGEEIKFVNQASLDRAVAKHNFIKLFRTRDSLNHKEFIKLFEDEKLAIEVKKSLFNKLLVPWKMRDNNKVFLFKRFRGVNAPRATNFCLQINSDRLDDLEKKSAAVIIYQHFGVKQAIGTPKNHESYRRVISSGNGTMPPSYSDPNNRLLFDDNTIWSFKELAKRNAEKRVFVTTQARLLNYIWVRNYLKYEFVHERDTVLIKIFGVDCPNSGHTSLSDFQLQGITFRLNGSFKKITLLNLSNSDGENVIKTEIYEFESHTIVSVPWKKLEYKEI